MSSNLKNWLDKCMLDIQGTADDADCAAQKAIETESAIAKCENRNPRTWTELKRLYAIAAIDNAEKGEG